MSKEQFEQEYDLGKLQVIRPQKRDFQMLATPRWLAYLSQSAHEDFTSDLLLNFMRDDTLFIDVGAHYGYYTLLAGTSHPNCKIISFEPVPENCEILRRNIELNQLKNVKVYNTALSNNNESRKFNITEASDCSGFHEHPLTKVSKVVELEAVTLDSLIKKVPKVPVIIKIDTEGHEPYVLQGMKKFLRDSENVKLIIEFNPKCLRSAGYKPENLLEEVSQLGFDIYVIDDNKRLTYKLTPNSFERWIDYMPNGKEMAYTNILCIKKEKSFSALFFTYSSVLAGSDRTLLELIKQLIADHGVLCSVVLPNEGLLRGKIDEVGASTLIIEYHWWCDLTPPPPPEEVNNRLSSDFGNVFGNLKELDKINPDVIVTNTLAIPWGAVAASFLSKPHVWSIREAGELSHNLKFHLPFQTVLKVIRDSSNLILVNSNAVRQALFGKTFPEKIPIIYPYIDIPSTAIHEPKDYYFTRTEAVKLIIFGTVMESKGQRDAILAVRELVQRKQDVELIVMGPGGGEYFKQLKEIVKAENLEPYVRFIGFKEDPSPVVDQADIILVCSRYESFGRVTLEAMLLKKPVIGTNTGGTPELINEGFNGLLYAPGDYHQLADKIEYLIQHKEKIKELGKNGYKFAKKNFTKEKSGGRFAELLRALKSKENPSSNMLFQFTSQVMSNIISNLKAVIDRKNSQITELETSLRENAAQIQQIQHSIPMQLVNRYQRIVEKLLRPGTRRRRFYERILSNIRVILNEGWRAFWYKFRQRCRKKSD